MNFKNFEKDCAPLKKIVNFEAKILDINPASG